MTGTYHAVTKELLVKIFLSEEMQTSDLRIENIANKLGTSKRTLQRRLKSEGTTYFKILDEIRSSRVKNIIMKFSVLRSAQLLGFSDRTSFTSAFKRWYKTTPTKYKQIQTLRLTHLMGV